MMALIGRIFGEYAMQVVIHINNLFEMFLCTLLFCWYFKRKKQFVLRLVTCLLISFGVTLLAAYIRTNHPTLFTRFMSSFLMTALPLLPLFVCFEENVSEKLICWCGGIAAMQASAAIVSFIYAAFGVDDSTSISFFPVPNETLDWLLYYGMHLALYVLCSLVFSRRKRTQSDKTSMRNIVLLSVFALLMVIVITNMNREYESDSFISRMLVKALLLVCFCFILVLRTGIFAQSAIKRELEIMDQLLYEEKKQYENVKNNVDVINMKCHDLKRRLTDLEGKLTQQEIEALKSAIQIYDSNIRTGNEILDVLLYEKQLLCEKEHISLSCMADGACLDFLSASHLYSLLGNALDNAIEAAREVKDDGKRTVSLVVKKSASLTEINVGNYYDGDCRIIDGIPQTKKADKVHHGFGTKSIRYIAKLYGGEVSFTAQNGMFYLGILFPPV